MLKLFPGFDVVANGLPYHYDLSVNRACVEVGVDDLEVQRRSAIRPAPGGVPPKQALPVQPFFDELARRGIVIEEAIVEEGRLSV